ncbi:MAG TPA: pinensin family lanthipeptide [Longimicrobiaceae bacterium]
MHKLTLDDLRIESFTTAPDVEEMDLNSYTRTVRGTCCGVECTGGTTADAQE